MFGIGTPSLLVQALVLLISITMMDCIDYNTSPLKASDVSGHLGKSATLRCHLRTGRHNRGWFRLTWARMEPDDTPLSFIHLPVRDKIPHWRKDVPSQLQSRIKPLITVQPGHVEFNIRISNLTCEDEAHYRCSAVTPRGELLSMAELRIFARPQTPKITLDYVTSRGQGHHLSASCKADVGLPPKMVVWYMKRPNETYFTIIDGQREATDELDGCHLIRTRTLTLDNTASIPPGTRYRCGYYGYITKTGMYDELMMESGLYKKFKMLEGKKKKEGKKRKGNLKCKDGKCGTPRNKQDQDSLEGKKRKEDLMCQDDACRMRRNKQGPGNSGERSSVSRGCYVIIMAAVLVFRRFFDT